MEQKEYLLTTIGKGNTMNQSLVGNQRNQSYLFAQRLEINKKLARVDAELEALRKEAVGMIAGGATTGNIIRDQIIASRGYADPVTEEAVSKLCAPFPGIGKPWTNEAKEELRKALEKFTPIVKNK